MPKKRTRTRPAIQPKAQRVPVARRYIRCSHEDSAKSGLGLEDQDRQTDAYFQLLKARDPSLAELTLADKVYRDEAVSAFKKQSSALDKRPGGRELLADLKPGDHVIFARMDRAFRDALEARRWIDYFRRMQVRVHFVDLQLDTETANGMMMFGMMSYLHEWYSATISERTRAALGVVKRKLSQEGTHVSREGREIVGLGSADPDHWKGREHLRERGRKKATVAAAEKRSAAADEWLSFHRERFDSMVAEGLSCAEMAELMNADGFTTRQGNPWSAMAAWRACERLGIRRAA